MKLIRAQFKNFRLLRDLELDFSTDRTLTVIRAENESGKTTILNGLQWALYGNDALPGKGRDYRLHPIDWDVSAGRRVPISAHVDFEVTKVRQTRNHGLSETQERYRIIRTAFETLEGETSYKLTESLAQLFLLTDTGCDPIKPPQAVIHQSLPPKLRQIFFTDSDRALSFIEAAAKTRDKRERVEAAIRSLLGLDVIDAAIGHVGKSASEFRQEAAKIEDDEELTEIIQELGETEESIQDLEEKLKDANSQFEEFDHKYSEIDDHITSILVKGDREKLSDELETTNGQIKAIDNKQADASKAHSQLFESMALARELLAPLLAQSFEYLDELRDRGELPQQTIPVLEEYLKGTTCICGESLNPDDPDGKHRRESIQYLIDENRNADALRKKLTDLYYDSIPLRPKEIADGEHWSTKYATVEDIRDELARKRKELGQNLKALEVQLGEIPDTDLRKLRDYKEQLRYKRDRSTAKGATYETQLEGLKEKHRSLVAKRENKSRHQRRGKRLLARETVAADIAGFLKNIRGRITNEKLTKVSDQMNVLFLEMIGADPEQGAIIRRAEISEKFDILVYGSNKRRLDPDIDLNGASRRALTLAFILSLTKVSGVKAPNVVDTPLGMMSGYVKQSVLKTAIRESSQLILFLTRSEIADCEEILDEEAGRVITLTNSAHYPRMLVNDPQVKERMTLGCECNHRKECSLCKRRMNVESEF